MNLNEVKPNKNCVVKNVKILDEHIKIRIMELGLITNANIIVKHKSLLKKTLLVVFNNSCFTLKENLAKNIEVAYA